MFYYIDLLFFFLSLCCTDIVKLADGGSRCAGRVEIFRKGQWGTVCENYWDMKIAAVACVRLVGGSRCSGRLEVLHGESWVTVCDADFNQQDAEVVCRELGCGSPVEVLGAAAFGRGEGQVWSEELQCRGNESQIHFCPKSSSLKHNCSHDNDVGLVCSVRLVDSGSRCAGRVEVLHRGQWGTVCDDNWDMRDAAVVCRELGCGEAVDTFHESHFGSGSGPIWMNDVDCSGSESTLKNCRSPLWGKHICNKTKNSGVICSGKLHCLKKSNISYCQLSSLTVFNTASVLFS
uniref:SRCR domain-containing protein n=1 Tax=Astyanax mexicanus TaxID=7994 RepID=A0A3B1J1E4_ASTMX